MAKNIELMGAVFPDVPSIKLPQYGGGLVSFDDTSDADAVAGDIAQGKTAYVNGVKVVGTNQGGGGGDEPEPTDGKTHIWIHIDPDTPANIGQDTVRSLPVTTDLEAALMWSGYGQIIATDPSAEDAQNGRYALYPDTISVDVINSIIPVKAVDPKDFKSVYTNSECSALKLAYAEIGECEHNGVKLKDAERTNLFKTLKGIYEQQVAVARVAFGNAMSSWNQTLYLESNMRMTSVSHEGILLGNEDQFFNIGMEKESSEKEEKQKIALSRRVYWSEKIGDETVQFSENRPFAFIGDSGMLGGAPLFTVRIIAAAH
jgi:hypothetical protein